MKKRVNISISDDLHKELKKKAVDEGISFSELLERLGREYIEREKGHLSAHPERSGFSRLLKNVTVSF